MSKNNIESATRWACKALGVGALFKRQFKGRAEEGKLGKYKLYITTQTFDKVGVSGEDYGLLGITSFNDAIRND